MPNFDRGVCGGGNGGIDISSIRFMGGGGILSVDSRAWTLE